jgi:opacity protein-like surface antigen
MDTKMKLLKISLLLLFAATAAFADDTFADDTTNTTKRDAGLYIGASSTMATSNDKTIRGDNQPLEEILGKGGFYNELQIGTYKAAANDGIGGKFYIDIYQNIEQNKEYGVGFGIELEKRLIDDIPLNLLAGFEMGYGWQLADDRDTSEGRIKFLWSTQVDHYSFRLGLSYDVAKHLSIDLSYALRLGKYKYSYEYVDTHKHVSQSTSTVSNGVRLGVDLRF